MNLECAHAVAVRVSEIAQGRNGAGVYVFVLRRASDDTRLKEEEEKGLGGGGRARQDCVLEGSGWKV